MNSSSVRWNDRSSLPTAKVFPLAFFFPRNRQFFYSQRAHGLRLSFLSADPLCMARWSVVSLLIKYCGSGSNHRQDHLEWFDRLEGVRLCAGMNIISWPCYAVGFAVHSDFGIAFDHLVARVERGGVLAQALTFVEGEDCHGARGLLSDLAADNDPASCSSPFFFFFCPDGPVLPLKTHTTTRETRSIAQT